jgi:hypothetical protein
MKSEQELLIEKFQVSIKHKLLKLEGASIRTRELLSIISHKIFKPQIDLLDNLNFLIELDLQELFMSGFENEEIDGVVYFVFENEEIKYIGETIQTLKSRFSQQPNHCFNVLEKPKVYFLPIYSDMNINRKELEKQLIKVYKPKFNVNNK